MRRSFLPLLVLFVACSSKGTSSPPAGGNDAGNDTGAPTGLELLGAGPDATKVDLTAKCEGTLATDGSALKFEKKTADWGLGNIFGNHLEAVDLDGDGYPDLLVHGGGSARTDPAGPANTQYTKILMNRPKPGGGRHFVDATIESGYGVVRDDAKPADGKLRSAQLAVAGDIDGDGDIDLFSGTYVDPTHPETDSSDRNEILLNDGKGHFKLAPKSAIQTVPTDVLPPTTSASLVDVDRDGILDVFVGYWYRNYGGSAIGVQARLFKGKGDGTFVDATPGSGLETNATGYDSGKNHRPAYGVTACDLDDDGRPELMVSAYGRQWNLLYQNLTEPGGTPSFAEIGQASGFAGDNIIDYTDNEFYRCYCATTKSCSAPSPRLDCSGPTAWSSTDAKPWRNNGNTFSTTCGDLNGDGKADLYSAEIQHWHIGKSSDPSDLLVNDGATEGAPIHFTRPGRPATGLDWPHPTTDWNEGGIMVANADLDLDGYDDIVVAASDYPGNDSLVFLQKPDAPGTFTEVGKRVGLAHTCTNGLVIADFDRDGDLDVIVGSSRARDCAKSYPLGNEVHFYENKLNDGPNKRGFLQVQLAGKGAGHSNKTGIGARVRIVTEGPTGPRIISKELLGGYGHFGMQHDTVLTFGLGATCAPKAIEVRWPDSTSTLTRFTGVGGGRRVKIEEGGSATDAPPGG